jgi:hypothetical protein
MGLEGVGEVRLPDGYMHGAAPVRKLQRALYRTSKQDKEKRLYSLYAKVWRADVLWEAWRQVRANKGAPVRVGAIPTSQGGTRPLGIATGEDRAGQTAMRLVVEPILAADLHDCSYGDRPKRDAQQASIAIREDLYHHAWGVVEVGCKSSFTSLPHRKRMKLITKRIADGSLRKLIKQTLKVGGHEQGQGGPTKGGGRKAHRSRHCTAPSTCTCWINCGISEAPRSSLVRRCTATPMRPFWYAAKAPSQGALPWKRSPRGCTCPSTATRHPSAVHNVATSTEQPAGMRGDGESYCDGVGERLPAHECQPSFPWAAALRQYPVSQVLAPEK